MVRRGEIFLEGILLRVCAMICEMISFGSLLFLNSDFLPGEIQLRWHRGAGNLFMQGNSRFARLLLAMKFDCKELSLY